MDLNKLLLIAGPCVIEDEKMLMITCEKMLHACEGKEIDYVFKASFDKANRSSIRSFRGPGIVEGLKMLEMVKKEFGVRILTDVHTPDQIKDVSGIVDIVQIPAFLARQTDFYIESGREQLEINVKKGQFMSPYEMKSVIEKFYESGGEKGKIWICERGTFMGYGNLVVDFRSIDIIHSLGVPYVFDATHSVQLPAAGDGQSLGQRQFIPTLIKSQLIAGSEGIFMEVHPNPEKAKSDSTTQIPLDKVDDVVSMIDYFYQIAKKNKGISVDLQ